MEERKKKRMRVNGSREGVWWDFKYCIYAKRSLLDDETEQKAAVVRKQETARNKDETGGRDDVRVQTRRHQRRRQAVAYLYNKQSSALPC